MADANLATEIADRLRRDILRGALPPGAKVKERDNAQGLGVSRTPMREAIRMLATEGLIVLSPARSPRVANPSFREVADQLLVLKTLEELSADLACERATPTDLARIRDLNRQMGDLYEDGDSLDLFEIDMAYHAAIAYAAHNASLAETHGAFLARLWRVRYLAAQQGRNRARARADHNAICAALEARDPLAVRAALETHLGQLANDIRPILESEQDAAAKRMRN
jgi:DNA-binding GntR family transcriptional regulator